MVAVACWALAVLCGVAAGLAQDATLLDAFAQDAAATPLWDAVERFREDPICLTAATAHDLSAVPGMSSRTASRVLKVASMRPRWTIEQISDSLCLGMAQRQMLLLCATRLCDTTSWNAIASMRVSSHLEAVERVSLRYGTIRMSAQGSRARDERFGVSHVGGAFGANVGGMDVLAGDVAVRCGTGLIMGTLSPSRGILGALSFATDAMRMRPWTSTIRSGFVRGGALARIDSVGGVAVQTLVVAGRRQLMASIDTLGAVTSIRDDGIVRTYQAAAPPTVLESVAGAALAVHHRGTVVGISAWSITYDRQLQTTAASDPADRGGVAASLYGVTSSEDLDAAWEVARDPLGHLAVVARMRIRRNDARIACAFRWIGPEYRARYGDAPTDATAAANERGITVAGTWKVHSALRLEALGDVRASFHRTYGVPRTVRGLTLDASAFYRVSALANTVLRIRYDDEDDGLRVAHVARTLTAQRTRLRLRCELALRIAPPLMLTVRADVGSASWSAHLPSTFGSAMMLRLRGNVLPWMDAMLQTTVFDATSIDAAAYGAEAPMPDVLRSVPLVGAGLRTMATVHVRLTTWCNMWASATTGPKVRRADVMVRFNLRGVQERQLDAASFLQ